MICLKPQIRNPKLETNRNDQGQNSKTVLGNSNSRFRVCLFRISIFGFRIFSRWVPPNVLVRADRVIR